jgi:hypothetical protein
MLRALEMRYNFACNLVAQFDDCEAALDMLGPVFERIAMGMLNHAKADADLDPLRSDPRFQTMVSAAETRLATTH